VAYSEPVGGDGGKRRLSRRQSRYSVVGEKQESIQDKIMQTNPVLEAFGNAMTVRNNNSSRFGKWLQMKLSPKLTILDCTITDYLLELTRVTSQGPKERTYHIFFMLIYNAKDSPAMKDMGVSADPKTYNYISKCQPIAPGIDDKQFFDEMETAFESLQFSGELQAEIYKVVLGILMLGNLNFEAVSQDDGTEGSKLAESGDAGKQTREAVSKLTEWWKLDKDHLTKPFMCKRTLMGGQIIEKACTKVEARTRTDAMVRLIYGRLFKWLIAKINVKLGNPSADSDQFFGMLDIAGFEIFEQNSLEQLFINLANELLQDKFNDYFFELDVEECRLEGITLNFNLESDSNKDIIALVNDPKTGILALLDEEMKMNKADDSTFTSKVRKQHKDSKRLELPKAEKDLKFTVKHFAGPVSYGTTEWMAKNADKPPDEAPDLFKASSISILQDIGNDIAAQLEEEAAQVGKKKAQKTVGSSFRASLKLLMEKLEQADPHFIRCVKPNPQKKPNLFAADIVNEQLLYSGVMEVVRIRQAGYASRIHFSDFNERYPCILNRKERKEWFVAKKDMDERQASDLLVKKLFTYFTGDKNLVPGCTPIPDQGMVIGKTKVFAKGIVLSLVEKGRAHAIQRDQKDLDAASAKLEAAVQTAKTAPPPKEADECWRDFKVLEDAIAALRNVMQLERDLTAETGEHDHHTHWFTTCDKDIAAADEVLAETDAKAAIFEDLIKSAETKDVRALRDAIRRAQEKGITGHHVENAQQVVVAEAQACAKKSVNEALKTRNVEDLRLAIEDGKLGGLSEADLAEIKKVYEIEAKKDGVRKDIATHIANRATSLSALKDAVKAGDQRGGAEARGQGRRGEGAREEGGRDSRESNRGGLRSGAAGRRARRSSEGPRGREGEGRGESLDPDCNLQPRRAGARGRAP
jgi:myosin heavy subunit